MDGLFSNFNVNTNYGSMGVYPVGNGVLVDIVNEIRSENFTEFTQVIDFCFDKDGLFKSKTGYLATALYYANGLKILLDENKVKS